MHPGCWDVQRARQVLHRRRHLGSTLVWVRLTADRGGSSNSSTVHRLHRWSGGHPQASSSFPSIFKAAFPPSQMFVKQCQTYAADSPGLASQHTLTTRTDNDPCEHFSRNVCSIQNLSITPLNLQVACRHVYLTKYVPGHGRPSRALLGLCRTHVSHCIMCGRDSTIIHIHYVRVVRKEWSGTHRKEVWTTGSWVSRVISLQTIVVKQCDPLSHVAMS